VRSLCGLVRVASEEPVWACQSCQGLACAGSGGSKKCVVYIVSVHALSRGFIDSDFLSGSSPVTKPAITTRISVDAKSKTGGGILSQCCFWPGPSSMRRPGRLLPRREWNCRTASAINRWVTFEPQASDDKPTMQNLFPLTLSNSKASLCVKTWAKKVIPT
jgi:hypothetical protein